MSVSASLLRWYFVLVVLGVSICIRVNTVTVRLRLVPSVFGSLLGQDLEVGLPLL